MATITKTGTENQSGSSNQSTWTFTIEGNDIIASDATFKYISPLVSAKYTGSNKGYATAGGDIGFVSIGGIEVSEISNAEYEVTADGKLRSWASGLPKGTVLIKRATGGSHGATLDTASFFTSSNSTTRVLNISSSYSNLHGASAGNSSGTVRYNMAIIDSSWGNFATLTLDAPPIIDSTHNTVSAITLTTNGASHDYAYAGYTSASVTVGSLSAQYGGTITDVTLKIGEQTASRSSSGTLTINPLSAGGTFEPTVTFTDSRGQTKTKTLEPITVDVYNEPTCVFKTERTEQSGKRKDEGTYAVVEMTMTFDDAIATAQNPGLWVTDENNTVIAPSVYWYSTRASDGTLSGQVTWANVSSGDTVYALISITGGFNIQKSYVVHVMPKDSMGTGATETQNLPTAFYTVDFLAGGHGIAFGQLASEEGFFCNMDAHFVDANNIMRALFDFVHPVGSYYETSNTSFNPNVTWGGTWVLETAGQVHVSSGTATTGTTFTVNGANASSGAGMSDGGEEKHWLTVDEMPTHNHGYYYTGSGTGTKSLAWWSQSGNGLSYDLVNTGGNQTHNTMQPYIVVNRWHRTA